MSGITVSKQFGVNPSIQKCSCCGKEMGIALFGTSWKDEKGKTAQAPMHFMNGQICDECKDVIGKGGIYFIEVRDGESGPNPYRTGRLVAVKEEAVSRMFTCYSKINYMEKSVFEKCFGNAEFK